MRFLSYHLRRMPFYHEVLDRLRAGDTFCDAGCCFAQELRWLVQDGIASEQLPGFDLEGKFIQMGYELFRDKDRLKSTLVVGNAIASPTSPDGVSLTALEGKVDVVSCSSFLHIWDWDQMVIAAKRRVSLTKPKSGSMIVGKQLGSRVAGSHKLPTADGTSYCHSPASMKTFWKQVADELGQAWITEAELYDGFELLENQNHDWSGGNDQSMIWFKAIRQD